MKQRSMSLAFTLVTGCALVAMLMVGLGGAPVSADTSFHNLGAEPFSQGWATDELITANDNWSGVPSVLGYEGRMSPSVADLDPQTVLTDTVTGGTVTVLANQTFFSDTVRSQDGVFEFHVAPGGVSAPIVALHASSTYDAPFLLVNLNTVGMTDISVSYSAVDIDPVNHAAQAVALHYRIGTSGPFTNVPAGYIADATQGPGIQGLVTSRIATLPANANNQPQLQIRILTTNVAGAGVNNDEFVGIDSLSVTGTNCPACPTPTATNTSAGPTATNTSGVPATTTGTPPTATNTVPPVSVVYHNLAAGPFSQGWATDELITANDNWSGVPSILGIDGENGSWGAGLDPRTVLTDTVTGHGPSVLANQTVVDNTTAPNDGVFEFHVAPGGVSAPTVALHASSKYDAPFLLIHLNTTGMSNITVQYDVVDIDGTATNNAAQQVALHYRVGNSGPFTNLAAGYIADATDGPSLQGKLTHINAVLPADTNNQPQVQFRILTTNVDGNDEFIGIDNLSVTGTSCAGCPTPVPTATNTNVPATATNTPVGPTATHTTVPATATHTTVPPTATHTTVPPTTEPELDLQLYLPLFVH